MPPPLLYLQNKLVNAKSRFQYQYFNDVQKVVAALAKRIISTGFEKVECFFSARG